MAISINPIFPVIAAQGAAPDMVLQPGAVIDAQVLKILANDLVRIAIANLSIEVLSEVPLQVGQTLQLAVSQTPDGIKLAMVGHGGAASSEAVGASLDGEPVVSNAGRLDIVEIAPQAATDAAPSQKSLTPLQALAVSAAAQTAAPRQNSLAPLFADLDAAERSGLLPPQLQQAVRQMLTLRPDLDRDLGPDVIKSAFQNSGLFLESALAADRPLPPSSAVPDLKAALLVLRQTLQSFGAAIPDGPASPPAVALPLPTRPLQASAGMPADPAFGPLVAASPALSPSLMPEIEVEEIFLSRARLPVAEDFSEADVDRHIFSAEPLLQGAGPRAAATAATLNLLQEALQTVTQKIAKPDQSLADPGLPPDPLRPTNVPQRAMIDNGLAAAHTNVPPPPFRGALPSAQPVAAPSIAADASLPAILHRLADDTDAAIARQTLLQVASLPDRSDGAAARTDPAAPRWNFEIPFSTLAGTAIAQFEIARDSRGPVVEAAKPVWRARFSLDIEPAGPVHAVISLTGETTSVRMWAERSATVAQLRAGLPRLSEALSRAELQPGDIVIRHGAPTQTSPAPAGHFLDRAL